MEPAPRLAVSVAGQGELVLFVHGIGGNRHHWRRQVEFFSRRFRAAAMDARGYGDSDDYEGPLRFDEFTSDVLRVADHFGATRFHLVGLSMGGRIARNVALRSPERLHSLVLSSTTPGFDALSPEQVAKFVAERRTRTPQSMKKLLGSAADPGAFQALVESFARVHPESYLKTLEASVAQDRAAPIEKIRVPTLVTGGEEDTVYPPDIARDMARRIPRAELHMFPGTGHLANLEQPDAYNQVVQDFITRTQEKRS